MVNKHSTTAQLEVRTMSPLNPYFAFNGNAHEVMKFYHGVFGGELMAQTFADSPVPHDPAHGQRIMHAELRSGSLLIMASDTMPGQPDVVVGGNLSLSINNTDLDEQRRLFTALSDGGKVTMDLQDTFWGARFGMLIDKFGTSWMFNCEKAG